MCYNSIFSFHKFYRGDFLKTANLCFKEKHNTFIKSENEEKLMYFAVLNALFEMKLINRTEYESCCRTLKVGGEFVFTGNPNEYEE